MKGNISSLRLNDKDASSMVKITFKLLIATMLASTLTACKLQQNKITLTSDQGDYIGAGKSYAYDNSNSIITINATGGHLHLNIDGDENWSADFSLPDGYSELQPGSYANLTRYPINDPAVGGLRWYGEGRACNTLTGWIVIDSVTYTEGVLTAIKLSFEHHCEGQAPALYGDITWYASDKTLPPGPLNPAPADLWQPDEGATPDSGNLVYLDSQSGDYIGQGMQYLYTSETDSISVEESMGLLTISAGDWHGRFKPMYTLDHLKPGYYSDLQRYPGNNPTKGGLSWSGDGRGCNELDGWFVVDNVTYLNDVLTDIELRFEQYCDNSSVPLHGLIRWHQ